MNTNTIEQIWIEAVAQSMQSLSDDDVKNLCIKIIQTSFMKNSYHLIYEYIKEHRPHLLEWYERIRILI